MKRNANGNQIHLIINLKRLREKLSASLFLVIAVCILSSRSLNNPLSFSWWNAKKNKQIVFYLNICCLSYLFHYIGTSFCSLSLSLSLSFLFSLLPASFSSTSFLPPSYFAKKLIMKYWKLLLKKRLTRMNMAYQNFN